MEVVALEQDVAQSSNAGEVGRDLVWIVVLFAAVVVISPGDDLVVFFCVVVEVIALEHELAQSGEVS